MIVYSFSFTMALKSCRYSVLTEHVNPTSEYPASICDLYVDVKRVATGQPGFRKPTTASIMPEFGNTDPIHFKLRAHFIQRDPSFKPEWIWL
jgi:hypothetical protein